MTLVNVPTAFQSEKMHLTCWIYFLAVLFILWLQVVRPKRGNVFRRVWFQVTYKRPRAGLGENAQVRLAKQLTAFT